MNERDAEAAVEQYAIELFNSHKLLSKSTIVHYEEDRQAQSERIVCKGLFRGRTLVGGLGGFIVALRVTHYGTTSGKARNSLIRKAIAESMFESLATRPTVPCELAGGVFDPNGGGRLDLDDEFDSDRTLADNSREYSVTFNFSLVRVANSPVSSGVA